MHGKQFSNSQRLYLTRDTRSANNRRFNDCNDNEMTKSDTLSNGDIVPQLPCRLSHLIFLYLSSLPRLGEVRSINGDRHLQLRRM